LTLGPEESTFILQDTLIALQYNVGFAERYLCAEMGHNLFSQFTKIPAEDRDWTTVNITTCKCIMQK